MALKKPVVIETTLADCFSNFQVADTLDVDGSLTVNESGGDKDTRIEGDTATNLVLCDASIDAFQVGTTVAGALIDSRSTGIVFNEPGGDVDFRVEGDSCTHLIFAQGDASLENIALLTDAAPDFQTMDRGIFIGAASSAPSGNPTAGTFLWSSGNELNIRNAAGTVKDLFASGAGTGDVVGPAGATDSAVALFDTATGKLLKNSVMIVTGSVVTGITEINGGIVFNEVAADVDFRVEGDTCTHLIFAQGDAALENIALLTDSAPNFQTMDRGLFIGAATTAPTGNPTAGTFMWSEGDELNIQNPSGTVKDLFSGGGGGTTLDVQVFAASGTWTKPANAVTVHVSLIGGGGGGSSGRRGAGGTNRGGGAGGGGGGYSYDSFDESELDATEAVTIGAGGAGGAGQSTNSTNGNAGTAGGTTEFDTIAGSLTATGGGGGVAGTTSAGTGGAGGTGSGTTTETGGAGGNSSLTVGSVQDGGSPTNKRAGAGGAGGSSLNSAGNATGSGAGGASGGQGGKGGQTVFNAVTGSTASFWGNPGLTGAAVIAGVKLELGGGGGGGGGNTSQATAGIFSGFGGAGGNFGAGGGGAQATLDNTGVTSEGGGRGADGLCVVVTECSA
jgi:hypothetical protein